VTNSTHPAIPPIVELRAGDIAGRGEIVRLVDAFYAKVRADEPLGQVFDGVAAVNRTRAQRVWHQRRGEASWRSLRLAVVIGRFGDRKFAEGWWSCETASG
jgi:hypothetical protein